MELLTKPHFLQMFRILAALGIAAFCGLLFAAPPTVGFELPRLDGTAFVRLDDYAGRAVLLNFWGSECPPCIAELPMLFAQASRHPGLQFLGIAVDPRAKATRFLARMQPTYPQLIAATQPDVLMRRFGNKVGGLPYTVMLNARHEVCASRLGEIHEKWLSSAIAACNAGASAVSPRGLNR